MGSAIAKMDEREANNPKYGPTYQSYITALTIIDENVAMVLKKGETKHYYDQNIKNAEMTFETCFYDSIREGYLSMIGYLVDNGHIQLDNEKKLFAYLKSAAMHEKTSIIKYLTQYGCALQLKYINELLNIAIIFGDFNTSMYLIEMGGDPYIPENHGFYDLKKALIVYTYGFCVKPKKERCSMLSVMTHNENLRKGYSIYETVTKITQQQITLNKICTKNNPLKFTLKPKSLYAQMVLI
jgi:hypothetical protein